MNNQSLVSTGLFIAIIVLITVFGIWSEIALGFLFLEVIMCVICSIILIHTNKKINTQKIWFHLILTFSAFGTISALSAINYAIDKYSNAVDLLYGTGSIFCLAILLNTALKFDNSPEIEVEEK